MLKKYKCPYCPSSFEVENSVYRHVVDKHPGKKYSKKTSISLNPRQYDDMLLNDLREGKITLSQLGSIICKSVTPSLNLSYVLDNKIGTVCSQLYDKLIRERKLTGVIASCNKGNHMRCFYLAFSGEIYVRWNMMTYWDGKVLVTVEIDKKIIEQMYSTLIRSIVLNFSCMTGINDFIERNKDGDDSGWEAIETSQSLFLSMMAEMDSYETIESIMGSLNNPGYYDIKLEIKI